MSNVMPHKTANCALAVFAMLAVGGCASQDISTAIAEQFTKSNGGSVNLVEAAPGAWERVCILGPYSNNETTKQTLGFEWNAEIRTSIESDDGVSVLLFVQGNHVVAYVEHPRGQGDFSNLTTQCFSRAKAQFTHDPHPEKGWPGLFQKHVA
jgi:hypothetical protein